MHLAVASNNVEAANALIHLGNGFQNLGNLLLGWVSLVLKDLFGVFFSAKFTYIFRKLFLFTK